MIVGFVGETHPERTEESTKHLVYTHKKLVVKYNNDQVY